MIKQIFLENIPKHGSQFDWDAILKAPIFE